LHLVVSAVVAESTYLKVLSLLSFEVGLLLVSEATCNDGGFTWLKLKSIDRYVIRPILPPEKSAKFSR